ncbi:carbohydrate kinase [Mucilaginibacter hurinus]|uniref:Carbohydrate kinase n=1 Tax=Mucilaginibacter hurinus TaxID=2201324 RepID=A0A367GPC3_9SPHI|nr:FGGY family carbohydrate kinase [Mucilaginibacter hurinus]RCH55342.1 carbohydrate kinase [Mucilaginibacter hurinus]
MSGIPVIAVFDVGKTNKKLFLFDEDYKIVYEKSARFIETVDEDGFPCENIESLRLSVFDSLSEVFRLKQFDVKAVNFSSYGASLVYIDDEGNPLCPMYNYLKPYPDHISDDFYSKYGGKQQFSITTASPPSGSLNSGLQLYRLKHTQPGIYKKVEYALHLPQYLSFLLSGKACSDITSIGCHTGLWDFEKRSYHNWVAQEGISDILAPIEPTDSVFDPLFPGNALKIGVGLHDSSAALVPYLVNFNEPFVLISTGTWCISLNPFNHQPLSNGELMDDCLCYLQYEGKPVKAARVFSGNEHEQQVKRISEHFGTDAIKYRDVVFDAAIINKLNPSNNQPTPQGKVSAFGMRDLNAFENDIEAYHQLVTDLVNLQVKSTGMILTGTNAKRIFVDGGFSKNKVFMNLLAIALPEMEVFAASMAQSTALGAAISLHKAWNSKPLPSNLIELNYFVGNTHVPSN